MDEARINHTYENHTYEPLQLDSDRIDGGRRRWRPLAAGLVLGLVLGALVGGLYGAHRPASYRATTALSVLPDTIVNSAQGQNSPTLDATSYIQSQLVVLNGSRLAAQVQRQLKLSSSPDVSSVQIGQSYVVQVTATAGSAQQALSVASATASAYAKLRSQQLTAELNSSVKSLETQISDVRSSLAAAQLAPGLTPSETAQETEYERLLGVDSSLKLALPQVNRLVTVLSPASLSRSSLSPTVKDLVGGAILGALLGLALMIGLRRATSRIRTVGDLASLGVPVLLPVVERRSARGRRNPAVWRGGPGRLLAARLSGNSTEGAEPIIVVAATPGVGASFVAATIAGGLTERGPVLLVLAAEIANGSRRRRLDAATGTAAGTVRPPELLGETVRLLGEPMPSTVPGVWLLPGRQESEGLRGVLPSTRSGLLSDVSRRATAAGWQVVIDAPALSDSDLALDCAAGGAVTALVVGRGSSRPAEVLSAAELFRARGTRFAGAVLNDAPRGMALWRRHRDAPESSIAQLLSDSDEPRVHASASTRSHAIRAGESSSIGGVRPEDGGV